MSSYKTKNVKVKKSVNVATTNAEIFSESDMMVGEERIIQNLDTEILYISFGDTATTGTNGEIALEQYGVLTTTFFGVINGIRSGAPANSNNTSAITI